MRVLFINSCCGIRSTGRICTDLAQEYEKEGHEVKIAFGRELTVPEQHRKYAVPISTKLEINAHAVYTRLTDRHGFGSKAATAKFLKWADDYNPNVLWLHNIHGYYIHIGLLFDWIKSRPNMQVKWTLHDCWAFTGHCAHFDYIGCEKWRTGCYDCPLKGSYPGSMLLDSSKKNYEDKRRLFTGIPNMTLITPSKWLAELAKQSFLAEYPVEVRYNTIDTGVFKPTPSDFRNRNGLEDKKIVLGVASVWTQRKGLEDFVKLAGMLDEGYCIVLVGVTPEQAKTLPENILAVPRTNSPGELAEIYSAADVFVNPTYEDNYPTVNLEAQACGTRVITYDTGGCRETLNEMGISVTKGDIDSLVAEITDWH